MGYQLQKEGKTTHIWRLKNILLNKDWVKEEIKEIKRYIETNKNDTMAYKILRTQKAVKVFIITGLLQEKRKVSNINNLTFHLKELKREAQRQKKRNKN